MSSIRKFLFSSLILTFSCFPALGQITAGTITGRVVDPQGAVVPGANVTVTSNTTNVAHAITTNRDGLYTVPQLLPGSYTVSVAAPNFKKELRNYIPLQVAQTLELDFTLSVGATTQTVTVTTAVPLVQTQSAAVGTVVDNQKIVEIPLNGRIFYSLTYLVPGVNPPVINDSMSQRGGFSVNGQQETANYDTLDGFNDVEAGVSGPAVRPSIDDIQEFKIYSGTYEAQYGHNVGGQVVLTTKSGGNQFHGDVFEFFRNQIFDAENYFNPLNNKPAFSQNDFGGTLGGPILHNKLFFFFSYEGLLENDKFISEATVPDTAQLGGTFTGPLTTPAGYNTDAFTYDATNNTTSIDTANLTTSQVTALNVAKTLLSYYPVDATPGGDNYYDDQPEYESQDQYALRLDYNINAKNSMYATLNYFNNPFHAAGPGHVCSAVPIPGFDCYVGTITQLYGGGWTHIFTANLINTLRAGYQRLQQPKATEGDNIDVDDPLGIPNNYDPTIANNQGVPDMTISGYQTYGDGGPQNRWDNTYDYLDNVLWNKGDHSFNFGVEITREIANAFTGSSNGSFTFDGLYTTSPIADAVLGLPDAATLSSVSPIYSDKYTYFAAYAQDTWKVTPNLTLNYGVRWEKDTPVTANHGQEESFNLVTGQYFIGGVDGVPLALWHAYNVLFEPRLGLSWRPFKTDRTVIQAGFGITSDSPNILNTFIGLNTGYPETFSETVDGTVAAPLSLPNPYIGTNHATENPDGIDPHWRVPANTAYTFGVQEQLYRNTVLTLTYQGSETAHENISYNINQVNVLLTPEATAADGIAARPFPDWNTVTYLYSNMHSSYNALYVKVQQNLTHGLSFLAAYTWAHSIDNDATPQNIYNLRSDKGNSLFDVRNRFVASPVYVLPFGVGRQYLNHGWAAQVVGGWELAADFSTQDGTPVTPVLGANVSNDGTTGTERPNVIGNPNNNAPHKLSEWFNTSVYSEPANGTFGDSGVDTVSSPGYVDLDANIARTFVLPRRMSMQFRAEMFNMFNHPNFEMPAVTYGTSSFGEVSAAQANREIQFALKIFY